ncbi:MAG: hypothetical protein MUO63_13560 [Desulfobulbaceae bacterium]|nr:hypothetical protein [Desulfobulbaceae bacterium]
MIRKPAIAFLIALHVILLSGLPVFLHLSSVSAAEPREVTVIVSSRIKPFVQALEGFRTHFPYPVSVNYVDDNPELAKHNISHGNHDLFVAIGPLAAQLIWENGDSAIPKMILMVLDPQELLGEIPLCGVHLRIPADDQFSRINDMMGSNRRVGVLFNPEENGAWVSAAQKAAVDVHINLVPLAVTKRQDVRQVLADAKHRIDTLLFIPDSTVISETIVSYLTKKALFDGIAVVGYNRFFLETGAVMTFNVDYEKVGMAGAEQADKILSGADCLLRPPPYDIGWNQKSWDFINKLRITNENSRLDGMVNR